MVIFRSYVLFFNACALQLNGLIQINNFPLLFVCRFFQGFAIGNYMGLVPIYIKEITPVSLRGQMGAFSQFFNIGAIVLCYSLYVIFTVTDVTKNYS
jgi:MFS family permease